MHQHKLTLYMTIPGMVDDEPSIEVFQEMIARTRSIREVNSSGYFVGANGVYGSLELIEKLQSEVDEVKSRVNLIEELND